VNFHPNLYTNPYLVLKGICSGFFWFGFGFWLFCFFFFFFFFFLRQGTNTYASEDDVELLICSRNCGGHLYVTVKGLCSQKPSPEGGPNQDCLGDQGVLAQTTPANQELLFRRDAFLGPIGNGWEVLKELAAVFR
jgi:hypothetical protein